MDTPLVVELIPDPDLGGFTARIPDISAYGEGETEDEAIADLQEAIRAYILRRLALMTHSPARMCLSLCGSSTGPSRTSHPVPRLPRQPAEKWCEPPGLLRHLRLCCQLLERKQIAALRMGLMAHETSGLIHPRFERFIRFEDGIVPIVVAYQVRNPAPQPC